MSPGSPPGQKGKAGVTNEIPSLFDPRARFLYLPKVVQADQSPGGGIVPVDASTELSAGAGHPRTFRGHVVAFGFYFQLSHDLGLSRLVALATFAQGPSAGTYPRQAETRNPLGR